MTNPITAATLDRIAERCAVPTVPPCPVCGSALELSAFDGSTHVYLCVTRKGYKNGNDEGPDEYYRHYDEGTLFIEKPGDADVIALLEAYRQLTSASI